MPLPHSRWRWGHYPCPALGPAVSVQAAGHAPGQNAASADTGSQEGRRPPTAQSSQEVTVHPQRARPASLGTRGVAGRPGPSQAPICPQTARRPARAFTQATHGSRPLRGEGKGSTEEWGPAKVPLTVTEHLFTAWMMLALPRYRQPPAPRGLTLRMRPLRVPANTTVRPR